MEFQNSDFFRSFQIFSDVIPYGILKFRSFQINSDHFRSFQINFTKRNLKIQIISDHFRYT